MYPFPLVIVLADDRSSRIFLRADHRAELTERAEYADTADLHEQKQRQSDTLVRSGGRPRVKPRAERSREELEHFLRHVAAGIDKAITVEAAESLAIVAPPFVLGSLRDYIKPATRDKLVSETCNDLVGASLTQIEEVMQKRNL